MELGSLLGALPRSGNPDVLVGHEGSDDGGVFRIREDLALVQTVDFITPVCDDPFVFGQVAAANSLSDVFAMGGRPISALNVCCFPKTMPGEICREILSGGLQKVEEAGAAILGGHTVKDDELKYGLAVTGTVHPGRVLTNAGCLPGDLLVLTKPLGTGILIGAGRKGTAEAADFEEALRSMSRLNDRAAEAAMAHGAHGGTDVTGFGLAGHALELARASGCSLRIRWGELPVLPGVMALIEGGQGTAMAASNREMVGSRIRYDGAIGRSQQALLFDPQTSGGLLLSLEAPRAERLLEELGEERAWIVGEVLAGGDPLLDIAA